MASHDDDKVIDFGKLERELNNAVEADARYWRENDAKFRAVNQKVATYDEFRDMVKAAHLKPLEKDDRLTDMKFNQPWNIQASKKTTDTSRESQTDIHKERSIPKTSQDFVRDWRRLNKNTSDQYSFLLSVGGEQMGKIFKTEIGFGFLGDFTNCFNSEFKAEDMETVVVILENLGQANRFSLSVQFMSSKEKQTCKELFKKLQQAVASGNSDNSGSVSQARLENLEKIYEMNK